MNIYFDHNATTPVDGRVLDAMLPYLRQHYGNPSNVHRMGRIARSAIEVAREQVAEWLHVQPTQVVFTSGGTEANNLALNAALRTPGQIVISAVEHSSVIETAHALKREVVTIPVDKQGRVTAASLEAALTADTRIVSIMTANNESGVVQDIATLGALVRERGFWFHSDAVQAAGKIDLDFGAMNTHFMTLSAHKIYGPKGVGALIVDSSLQLRPQLYGGGQERGRRSGTENVAAIVGFGCAAELARVELDKRRAHLQALHDQLEQRLSVLPGVTIFANQAQRLPNTTFFAVQGIDGETLVMELDRRGISLSSGSACASRLTEPSYVLSAMGVDETAARGALRVSLGKDNTQAEVDHFVLELSREIEALQVISQAAWA